MLNREKLIELYRALRAREVLSVYIDADGNDPSDRRVWFMALEQGLDRERGRVQSEAPAQLGDFDRARRHVEAHLEQFSNFLPGKGWVGFATADALEHAEEMPVPMPHLVRWERGARVAPYVRALKQDRMVVGVLADQRKARIFTYRGGELEERADLLTDVDFGDYANTSVSKRASTYSGTRGETGTDAARRALERSASKMHARLAEVVKELAGPHGFIVLGGSPDAESSVARHLQHLDGRLVQRPALHLAMTEPEIRAALEEAASELSRRYQADLLHTVMDQARARGRGALGAESTEEALRDRRVDTLLVTRTFRERYPDLTDHFVGAAFEQGAAVEELSGDCASELEAEGEGVGARLRYTG